MLIGVAAALAIVAPESWAHKANVFAYVENDKIVAEGYFSGKAKAVYCAVQFFDANGGKIHEGKTDSNGVYSVKIADLPKISGDVKVVISSSDGHKADFTIKSQDLNQSAAEAPSEIARASDPKQNVIAQSPVQDHSLLKKTVEDIVDARVRKLLAEQKDKGPSVVEIIGGIGWIFGIVGMWAYFKPKKQIAENQIQ